MAADDIILGYAKIWTAPTGTAFPAPSIGYGVDWGGAWTYFGDTLTPLTFGGERAVYDVMIQQSTASQKSIVTKDEHNFKTVMARHDVNMFNLLLLGTLTNTAPGSGTPGYYSIVFGGTQSPTRLPVPNASLLVHMVYRLTLFVLSLALDALSLSSENETGELLPCFLYYVPGL